MRVVLDDEQNRVFGAQILPVVANRLNRAFGCAAMAAAPEGPYTSYG